MRIIGNNMGHMGSYAAIWTHMGIHTSSPCCVRHKLVFFSTKNDPQGFLIVFCVGFLHDLAIQRPYGIIWGHMNPYGDPYKFSLLCAAQTFLVFGQKCHPKKFEGAFFLLNDFLNFWSIPTSSG